MKQAPADGKAISTVRRFVAPLAVALLATSPIAAASTHASETARAAVDYEFTGSIKLGAPGFQDYLAYDPVSRRLYVSHYDRVSVIDAADGRVVGSVGPFHDSHGVALVDRLGKGYADSGADGVVKVFRLSDLTIENQIKVSPDADGMVFDPNTDKVLVVAGDSHDLNIIDPERDVVTRTVSLPGKPEFLATDDHGHVFINLADTGKVAEVGIASGAVEAVWPLAGCAAPHGLAFDPRTHRLFSGCANGRLVAIDPSDGRIVAELPIGPASDAVVVDPRRGLVFSSSALGTLSVVAEHAGDRDKVARTIPTFFGARNAALDPVSGELFVAYGEMKLESSLADVLNLRFGWDGVDVATFEPRF